MYGLKADLNRLIELETEELKARELEVATGKEDLETMRNRTKTNRLWFAGHRGPEWLRRAIAEKERADKAEALVNELRSDSKTDDAVMEGQAKRIEELETLVRDLVEASNEARALIATLTASYSCSNHTRAIYDVMDKTALVLMKAREALER